MTEQEINQRAFQIVRRLFKDDYGNPFEMTPGQIELFRAIYERREPRNQFDCYTQYGKSDVVSMAVLLRAATFAEKWPILGATKDKAGIIMGKLIKHIFENEYTLAKFQIGKDESLERIKRDRSRDHITFRVDDTGAIGEVLTLSADARRKTRDAGDILIGHGAPNLIEDDAALIPDNIHGKAMRMLGGHKENFLLKITNSFNRNHAYRSSIDPKFKLFKIDYNQGIDEGRLTPEYIEEMKGLLDPVMFGILYECKYPPEEMIEDGGWMPLFTETDVEEAQKRKVEGIGFNILGCDIAEGINANAFVIRRSNIARVQGKTMEKDLMKTAEYIDRDIIMRERVSPQMTFVDAVGVGSGVVSRLHERGLKVNGIKSGEKAKEKNAVEKQLDPISFYNQRAEMYWKARLWIRQGGALEPSPDWAQLTKIRYRESSDKTIQIMPKEEMRVRGLMMATESTDVPDAFALTFANPTAIIINNQASEVKDIYAIGL